MQILLVNQPWPAFGGSETYVLTIAAPLQRLGHETLIYAPGGGRTAEAAEERGLAVVTGEPGLPPAPDVVVTQDGESAYAIAERYPDAVRVYVSHSPTYEPQRPPQLADVCQAVVVMNDATRTQFEITAAMTETVRLRQPVDLQRFTDRGGLGERPRRALLLGNHWGGPGYRNYELVAGACEGLGIELDHVGAGGRVSKMPELEIASADVVFGLGRCVIEAMAAARAAYVFGNLGGDGWVTADNYELLEAIGFAGGATPGAIDAERLRADLERFDPDMGQVNRELAYANHDATRHVATLVTLFERLRARPFADPQPLAEVRRLIGVQREVVSRAALAETDARRLRAELQRVRGERDHLDALLGQRRYRLARLLGAPADLMRRLLARTRRR